MDSQNNNHNLGGANLREGEAGAIPIQDVSQPSDHEHRIVQVQLPNSNEPHPQRQQVLF